MSEYMALYRKWRPKVFADVIGQDHITKVLRSEVTNNSISHAYLFCGSRGTGKTTCAKILAKAVSCENPQNGDPCGVCSKCMDFDNSFDIVEMDAASNNGVDDIRDLRDKINFMPIEMKRRVYIIDEVHMLSAGAFNALLKTLEEPPEHVMFILATTELNKIPATILSRCKRFDFHRISPEDMVPRLRMISDSENIGIDNDALRLIAYLATGAMRDALSMLELFVGQTGIDREAASKALGVVGNATILELIDEIADRDCAAALKTVANAYASSKDMSILCSELGEMFRNILIMKYASSSVSELIDNGKDVIEALRNCEEKFTPERLLYSTEIVENAQNKLARSGLSRRTVLELMVMRLCNSKLSTSLESLLERISALESNGVKISAATSIKATVSQSAHTDAATIAASATQELSQSDFPAPDAQTDAYIPPAEQAYTDADIPDGVGDMHTEPDTKAQANPISGDEMLAFGDVLEDIQSRNVILYSMISDAKCYLDNDTMTLKVSPMGLFMINADDSMKKMLEQVASDKLGYSVKLKLIPDSGSGKNDAKPDLGLF